MVQNKHTKKAPSTKHRNREATRQILIDAVGEVLAEKGFLELGINTVAQQAQVDKVLIYRYFGGLKGLISAFGQEGDFWPSIEELAGGDINTFRKLPLEEKLVALGRNFLTGIRKRPLTQEIMAWELVQRNELTEVLEIIRETRILRFVELFLPPEGIKADLIAVISIASAGISYLVCRARWIRWYSSMDLEGEEGWQRIDDAMAQIARGIMKLS